MRFSTDDRVTVTDPKHWHYGEQGIVEDYDYDAVGGARRYLVSFDGRDPFPFSVEQLDFTEEATKALNGHVRRRTIEYDGRGFVAWCSCGTGSPPKATSAEAERSLQEHIDNPRELPK